ncbi:hypothetical protein SKA58_18700 [Sphingomonas sp. SKA58]|nr:hypothetical protein SKA58_18700 [Sphingomonas sp. SKA58]
MPRILDILLDLPLFPSRSRVTELSFEQIVADHRQEACVDGAFLATPDLVDGRAHIVIDTPARHAAQHAEGVIMGVEQHLMGLQQVGAHDECPAVTELEMRDLQLGPNPGDDCPVLTPIKLESFPRRERQGHECPTPANLLLAPIIFAPVPSKSGNPVVGSFITQAHQIGVKLLDRALLLARSAHIAPQPGRQMLSKWVQFAWSIRHLEPRIDRLGPQIFADRVA